MSFYSITLPKIPTYDYIHYKNYFLMTTLIVIILQELYLLRLKRLKAEEIRRNNINSVSMNRLDKTKVQTGDKNGNIRDDLNQAFDETKMESTFQQMRGEANDDEDTFFEVDQTKNLNKPIVNSDSTKLPANMTPNFTNQQYHPQASTSKAVQNLNLMVNNNQTKLLIILVGLLLIQYIYFTVLLLKSVTFSFYVVITPFIHPSVLLFAFALKNRSCKLNK
jgi:hypothetical protein